MRPATIDVIVASAPCDFDTKPRIARDASVVDAGVAADPAHALDRRAAELQLSAPMIGIFAAFEHPALAATASLESST
jgi:hypothetical protein